MINVPPYDPKMNLWDQCPPWDIRVCPQSRRRPWYNPSVTSDKAKQPGIPIAVISDGKPGHENQSLGTAERVPNSNVILLRHKLREGLKEGLLRAQVGLSGGRIVHPRALLRYAFQESEINRLVAHSPRAVIAAGTPSASLCILAGRLTGAKTCVCMRPSMLPLGMFDLAIVPAHDNPPDEPNILRTLAAPNRVSPENLAKEADRWWDELPAGDRIVSWIIGGPSASARFDETHVLGGLLETLVWARQHGWQVWLSTARRTPVSLEEGIAKIARGYPALTWMLLWHRDQRNPLYAMFARSRLAIVTSDSVSMIAEAASAGKGPLVYQAGASTDPSAKPSKHDRMLENLIEAGYGAQASTSNDLLEKMQRLITGKEEFPVLNDTDKAAERLFELLRD